MSRLVLLLSVMAFTSVTARKSYYVKEALLSNDLNVHSPKVKASDCKWCFLEDGNNEFCFEGDLTWTVESKTEQEFQRDDQPNVDAHYSHSFIYQTIQSGAWTTIFDLKKLYSNEMSYEIAEFTAGLNF